eukprot:GEMP01022388.1.p1 GENE.GEMP01022388.1~~GEMP01022388.1.p1  ORF type:complete len:371 (+),score=106.84 GEMP01022388.1:145-1257(+)
MSEVYARYLTGDEVTIPFSAPAASVTINNLQVRVAALHSRFAPDVVVLSHDGTHLDNVDAEAPSSVTIILKDTTYTSDTAQCALIQHARSGDVDGIKRIIAFLNDLPDVDAGSVATLAILRYLRSMKMPPHPLTEDATQTLAALVTPGIADLMRSDTNGRTVIHCAAARGLTTLLDLMLSTHSDSRSLVNQTNNDGSAALDAACYAGRVECVDVLLKHGANVSHADNGGRNALDGAAGQGYTAIVHTLISHHIDVNNADLDGWTALSEASASGHTACVEALVRAKADATMQDHNGWTALCWAASRGHDKIVDVLLREGEADINHTTKSGWTAQLLASSRNHAAVLAVLAAYGAPEQTVVVEEEDDSMSVY